MSSGHTEACVAARKLCHCQDVVKVRVIQDDNAESPRTAYDNFGVMACWHRHYQLGDVQPREEPDEWLKANAPPGSVVLALYLYDHSGITMRAEPFGDPWDSGQVGWYVATPDAIRANFLCKRISKKTRALAESCLRSEVKTYDAFLRGDVWGFEVEGGGMDDLSCWGFYGDDLDGMKGHVPEELHPALEEAWEKRGER